jgi:predicted nucleic acid-binding protein
MAVFVDTGVFVALNNVVDNNHLRSKELFKQALNGTFGRIFTSDQVIEEALTAALVRTKNPNLAVNLGTYLIESPRIT